MLSKARGLLLSNEFCKKVVLKLLRVGSAQNAPLELKHEIVAIRMLQFGLPGANLGQAVTRAANVEELVALHAINDGEPGKEDDDAENSGTEVDGTATERESQALVLARIPKEARCKAKITDEGGVKGLSWVDDGGALSGTPIVSGAYGSRVVVRWSASAAGRSAPGLGSAVSSARRPTFGVSELGRLLHTMADARMGVAGI
jgi:hypothetical protein